MIKRQVQFKKPKTISKMLILTNILPSKKKTFLKPKKHRRKLHMVFNPPYDERLDIHMEEFYKNIGDTLKKNYPGTNAWFITANLEALKFVGLKPSRKIKLFNASLEARLVKYEMYEGSKRTKFQVTDTESGDQMFR